MKIKKTKLHFVHCNAPQIVFFMFGHKKPRNAASNWTTGLHHEPHPTKCPSVDTCKIFGSSCPRCFVDDPYLDVLCRSKTGCGPTNDQAVDSPHNVLTSNAFPDNVPTKVSPNTVQQIVQPVRSSHAGFHAKAVTSQWQLVGPTTLRSSLRNVTSILLRSLFKIVR